MGAEGEALEAPPVSACPALGLRGRLAAAGDAMNKTARFSSGHLFAGLGELVEAPPPKSHPLWSLLLFLANDGRSGNSSQLYRRCIVVVERAVCSLDAAHLFDLF